MRVNARKIGLIHENMGLGSSNPNRLHSNFACLTLVQTFDLRALSKHENNNNTISHANTPTLGKICISELIYSN